MERDSLLTTGDVAALCSCSVDAVKIWIRKGMLAAYATPGGHWRVGTADLLEFMRKSGMRIPASLAARCAADRPAPAGDESPGAAGRGPGLPSPVASLTGQAEAGRRIREMAARIRAHPSRGDEAAGGRDALALECARLIFGFVEDRQIIRHVVVATVSAALSAGRVSLMTRTHDTLRIVSSTGLDIETGRTARSKVGDGIAGRVAATGEPVLCVDVDKNAAMARVAVGGAAFTSPSFMSVPIRHGKSVLGVINVANPGSRRRFSAADLDLCEKIASIAALALATSDAFGRLRAHAATDELTGLPGTSRMRRDLASEQERTARYAVPTAIVILDMDRLTTVNAAHGRDVGDAVISLAGRLIERSSRTVDLVYRLRNDVFLAILPHTTKENARLFALRIAGHIPGTVRDALLLPEPLTMTAGAAAVPDDAPDMEGAIEKAEEALRRAKLIARGGVVAA